MNAEAAAKKKWTPAEYLAWERSSPERHELVEGEIFAMAGASFAHGVVRVQRREHEVPRELFVLIALAFTVSACTCNPAPAPATTRAAPSSGAATRPEAGAETRRDSLRGHWILYTPHLLAAKRDYDERIARATSPQARYELWKDNIGCWCEYVEFEANTILIGVAPDRITYRYKIVAEDSHQLIIRMQKVGAETIIETNLNFADDGMTITCPMFGEDHVDATLSRLYAE